MCILTEEKQHSVGVGMETRLKSAPVVYPQGHNQMEEVWKQCFLASEREVPCAAAKTVGRECMQNKREWGTKCLWETNKVYTYKAMFLPGCYQSLRGMFKKHRLDWYWGREVGTVQVMETLGICWSLNRLNKTKNHKRKQHKLLALENVAAILARINYIK